MISQEWVDQFHQTSARLPAELIEDVVACGYFPQVVIGTLDLALGGEPVLHHLVHHEATFNTDEIHRHLSVLVLTPTRLIVSHTDDQSDQENRSEAITSTESLSLSQINSVALTQVVSHPEAYGTPTASTVETWLTVGWGVMRRLELEPATCPDPTCEADHGYTGALTADDITVRMSPAADGAKSVAALVAFGSALQQTTAGRG